MGSGVAVGRLLDHVDKPPSAIEQEDVVAYLDAEQPMSDGKRSNVIGALRVFFRECCDREVMEAFAFLESTTPTEVFERFEPERDPDDESVFQTVKQPASRKFRQVSDVTGVKVTA